MEDGYAAGLAVGGIRICLRSDEDRRQKRPFNLTSQHTKTLNLSEQNLASKITPSTGVPQLNTLLRQAAIQRIMAKL